MTSMEILEKKSQKVQYNEGYREWEDSTAQQHTHV